MSITTENAVPYFGVQVTETKDGTTYIQLFKVPLNGVPTASPLEQSTVGALALRAVGVPQYGAQYPANNQASCTLRTTAPISGQEKNKVTYVIVTCTFSTIPVDKRDEQEDPFAKRPDVKWSTRFERIALINARRIRIFHDGTDIGPTINAPPAPAINLQGDNDFSLGITNSAGDPFQEQPEQDVAFPIVTITQNVRKDQWNPKLNASIIGTVNEAAFTVDGYQVNAEEALLLDRVADIQYLGKISYRTLTTTLLFKNTHDIKIQDRGFNQLVEESDSESEGADSPSTQFGGQEGVKKRIMKVDGEDTQIELLLDSKGNPLGEGARKSTKPFYLYFATRKLSNFAALNLPQEKQ